MIVDEPPGTIPLIYVAAPYTHPDPISNTRRAFDTADFLMTNVRCVAVVPHASMLWDLVSPRPPEWWYSYDLHLLSRCDAVFRVAGLSAGADAEVHHAERIDIPVFFDATLLAEWCEGWPVPWSPSTI